jgi:hypothetical protein
MLEYIYQEITQKSHIGGRLPALLRATVRLKLNLF